MWVLDADPWLSGLHGKPLPVKLPPQPGDWFKYSAFQLKTVLKTVDTVQAIILIGDPKNPLPCHMAFLVLSTDLDTIQPAGDPCSNQAEGQTE